MLSSIRMLVVLPAPFGPRSPKMLPRGTVMERPETARFVSYDLLTSAKVTASAEPPSPGMTSMAPPMKSEASRALEYAAGYYASEDPRLQRHPPPSVSAPSPSLHGSGALLTDGGDEAIIWTRTHPEREPP